MSLHDITLNEAEFVSLLTKLISKAEFLQNSPPSLIPKEDLAAEIVIETLKPYTAPNGPLKVEHISYFEGRGNVIITYPGTTDKTVTLIGSHMDVVPADPEQWTKNPFELTREGDKLYGRGTTDCLGHVALVTMFFVELARRKPALKNSICSIFIASEESTSVPNIGVDGLMLHGVLDRFKNGPLLWVDTSDSQPCVGTAGALQWHLKATGKLFHSGLPHKGVNALELGMEAIKILQDRFYSDFPAHPREKDYNFATPSTMKPTQMVCAKGSLNQIPPHATISGDIRLTPFYDVNVVMEKVSSYVADLNSNLGSIPVRGPASTYILEDGYKGKLELTWAEMALSGIACDLKSPGFSSICKALTEVKGVAKPFAVNGSLPLVHELQQAGLDLQLIGFGLSNVYHANDEYCLVSDMADGIRVLSRFVFHMEESV